MIEGIELSVLLKDTIKMNAVKAFVPRANNADASVSERGPELFQTVIIPKRNFIISEEPLQTQRLCSEQSEQHGIRSVSNCASISQKFICLPTRRSAL